MESKKAIIVCQLNNRITVETAWDGGLVNFFRTIEKRFWCSQNKVWSFPLPTKEKITEELTRRGYTIDCSESKPVVNITENGGNTFEVEADYVKPKVEPTCHTPVKRMPIKKLPDSQKRFSVLDSHL